MIAYQAGSVSNLNSAVVPSFVTSNSFIGACYAKVILGFVEDWFAKCVALSRPN
jgi:hypothetical protein